MLPYLLSSDVILPSGCGGVLVCILRSSSSSLISTRGSSGREEGRQTEKKTCCMKTSRQENIDLEGEV